MAGILGKKIENGLFKFYWRYLLNREMSGPKDISPFVITENGKLSLQLKPLSQITDKDAAKLFLVSWRGNIKWLYYKFHSVTRLAKLFKKEYQYSGLNIKQIERARKMEYAYEYEGASVEEQVERGWVTLRNENENDLREKKHSKTWQQDLARILFSLITSISLAAVYFFGTTVYELEIFELATLNALLVVAIYYLLIKKWKWFKKKQ